MKKLIFLFNLLLVSAALFAQDSTVVKAHPSYNDHGAIHRLWFGENYRREWAADTKVPVIKISEIKGGLKPTERGGGHQTRSLRLQDKEGREWVLRSIEKFPEVLIPEALRNTFARDWVDDNMSAQHPYGSLIVPVLADAVGVPHSNPIIGWVAPDSAFGEFATTFENTLCLLEEREPLGKSDNTEKMFKNLDEDSENKVDAISFLKAQLLDVVIGDWDRHVDQWRWKDEKDGEGKYYRAIPRDRDQVFYVNEGVFPKLASRSWLLPFLQGYDYRVRNINTYLWESRLMATRILTEMSYEQWMSVTQQVVRALPDSVLEQALRRLPAPSYKLRHGELLEKLKSQRDHLTIEADKFYRFINKIVEIKASDKGESFFFTGDDENLQLQIKRAAKEVFSKKISPEFTKEVWVYTGNGNDSVFVNTKSDIKIRLISGEKGHSFFAGKGAGKNPKVYSRKDKSSFEDESAYRKHLSNDTLNTKYIPINRYDVVKPAIDGGFNRDDGLILGAGINYTHQGFRKVPFASQHRFTVAHSFSTSALRIKYSGDWTDVFKRADFSIDATLYGPNNTINFYGRGNDTKRLIASRSDLFYRSRFDLAQLEAAVKWSFHKTASISAGAVMQYYTLDPSDNLGRFIGVNSDIGSYDSASLSRDKVHAGLTFGWLDDRRSSKVIPVSGSYLKVRIEGLTGLNTYSKSFVQIKPEYRLYRKLSKDSSLIIGERIGGGLTFGNTAFYQSLFLGGHDNLYGFHQYRFAGKHLFYNNIDLRWRLAKFSTFILPGEFGISGFFDTGRVWEEGENSDTWHHGYGGSVYVAPAHYAVIQFIGAHSKEGFYPYLKLSMRF